MTEEMKEVFSYWKDLLANQTTLQAKQKLKNFILFEMARIPQVPNKVLTI
jgi:hypothetical protein